MKSFSPTFRKAFFGAWKKVAHEADIRRNDNAAYKAVSMVDKGVETAGGLVFWLKINAILLLILIVVGVVNLVGILA